MSGAAAPVSMTRFTKAFGDAAEACGVRHDDDWFAIDLADDWWGGEVARSEPGEYEPGSKSSELQKYSILKHPRRWHGARWWVSIALGFQI